MHHPSLSSEILILSQGLGFRARSTGTTIHTRHIAPPLYVNQGSLSEIRAKAVSAYLPFHAMASFTSARPCQALPVIAPASRSHPANASTFPHYIRLFYSTPSSSSALHDSLRGLSSPPLGGLGTSHRPVVLSAHLSDASPVLNNCRLKANPGALCSMPPSFISTPQTPSTCPQCRSHISVFKGSTLIL